MSGGSAARTNQNRQTRGTTAGLTALQIPAPRSAYNNSMQMQSLATSRDEITDRAETSNRKRHRDYEADEVNGTSADKRSCYQTPHTAITEYEAPWYRGYQAAVKNEGNFSLSQADIVSTVPAKKFPHNSPPLGTTPHFATGIQLFADGNYNLKGSYNFFKRKLCPDTINALRRRNSILPVYVYRGDQRLRNQLAHLCGTVVDLSNVDLSNEKQLTERLNRKTQQDMMV